MAAFKLGKSMLVNTTFLLLVFSHGRALLCNLCFSRGPFDACVPKAWTCAPDVDGCGSLIFLSGPMASSFVLSCLSAATCQKYQDMSEVVAICCNTDLCN